MLWLIFVSSSFTVANNQEKKVAVNQKRSAIIAVYENKRTSNIYFNSTLKSSNENDLGEWSQWSSWTPCSTSCGLGVTKQTRHCLKKPVNVKRNAVFKRQRLKESPEENAKCRIQSEEIRYHVCNKQPCPITIDFREAQCTSFNEKLFNGQKYTWTTYHHSTNQCSLNCQAIGYRFYAVLKPNVIDGTPCNGTNDTSLHICVEGQCKVVGCDGSIGGHKKFDGCGVCGGDNSTCRLISGIFTKLDMPGGYNFITRLPKSACNITIHELKPSANSIALKHAIGSYILNGNWSNSWPGDYEGAGTVFTYRKENENFGETVFAPGPLMESVDLILISRYINPGIKYEYKLPLDVPVEQSIAHPLIRHHSHTSSRLSNRVISDEENYVQEKTPTENEETKINVYKSYDSIPEYQGFIGDEAAKPHLKNRKKKFNWKLTGYSECSKSCGGGFQTSTMVCIKEHNQQQQIVPDKRCHSLEKPQLQVLRCNMKPCDAQWSITDWSPCSVSCGLGVQTREIVCKQQISSTLVMSVAETICSTPIPTNVILSKACQKPSCEVSHVDGTPYWNTSPWSKCSVACGMGIKSRSVRCTSEDETKCKHNEKPAHQATCDMGPCALALTNAVGSWIISEWSQCSETCGTGTQSRKVYCSLGIDRDSSCDQSSKPEETRACLSDKDCSGVWFTGPWSQCSEKCGWGNQTRSTVCMSYNQKEWKIVSDNQCNYKEKPSFSLSCFTENCGSMWFTSDWLPCSRTCDLGVQKRDVKCLNEMLKLSIDCEETNKPLARRSCNLNSCNSSNSVHNIYDESRIERDNKPLNISTPPSNLEVDSKCVDMQMKNCNFVAQARLCSYKYYKVSCCNSCRNKS
ncbi:thrombospondin type-1 domain-containing protein 4-like isoform X2 [Daktulosphaira vitifoliae]|uniref:thrombospondin type-1 domain-containing protein 4-like isoform X2 n=1 Tax=Daktulosphaira vitifoliae TaxID=58002 RepID=UPI0021AA4133|nr:thrombospondin type-1 domain-containing protein 4-like isoform X2 [Daktulosphaira vitifoliae]